LAYWIVASSLHNIKSTPYDALASVLDPIKNLFTIRNLDFLLRRLAVFDQRFKHINQKYDWKNWSTDLHFWECIYQALWSEKPVILPMPLDLPSEYPEEKLQFLTSFELGHEDGVGGIWRNLWSVVKRRRRVRQ
jgi:hypothetical protein